MTDDKIALRAVGEGLGRDIPARDDRLCRERLIGAVLLEQNDERAVQRARYMSLETKVR